MGRTRKKIENCRLSPANETYNSSRTLRAIKGYIFRQTTYRMSLQFDLYYFDNICYVLRISMLRLWCLNNHWLHNFNVFSYFFPRKFQYTYTYYLLATILHLLTTKFILSDMAFFAPILFFFCTVVYFNTQSTSFDMPSNNAINGLHFYDCNLVQINWISICFMQEWF